MKIVIVGVGKLGEYLAYELVHDENEVTLVDLDFDKKNDLINNLDVNYMEGNGVDSKVLEQAGVSTCDLLISVTGKDELNLMISMIGKKLGAKHTIARIRNPEYANSISLLKDDLGLSMAINPEQMTASSIARTLNIPSALDSTSMLKGKIEVITLKVKENSKLEKSTIRGISKRLGINIIVCAIERDGKVIIPKGDTKLLLGDKVHITGTRKDINALLKYMGLITEKTKKVIISGGSAIAVYLTNILIDMGMSVKIIELDKNRCFELAEKLPKAIIINGDSSDQKLLYQEGIEECDAFVALTSIDEENIVYSMFASLLKVPKIITKVNHIKMDGVVESAKIDSVVAPKRVASNQIVQYVRAMASRGGSSCEAIYKYGDIFELIEFKVKDDFRKRDVLLKDLELKEGMIIGAILRDKSLIFPCGKDMIMEGDTIVVVNGQNKVLDINDILK
ncbi:MAG: Trk system potassium transporter TrkA [Bacilli bacterium]|nr:Trk system potassium transporter TrkA [Bacilli bacterium]